jgi:hypothetical protein
VSDEDLAKDLCLLSALTIGVGTMIGAGIFVLPGAAVATAGPIVVASFVLGGVIAGFTALSASELGTAHEGRRLLLLRQPCPGSTGGQYRGHGQLDGADVCIRVLRVWALIQN